MNTNEVVIIADPNGKGYDFAKQVYQNVAGRENLNFPIKLVDLDIFNFRDGEIKVRVKENVRGRECFFIHDSNKEPSEWFLQLALTTEALKYSDAGKIIVVNPYLRFSRQDRKDKSRVALNSRVVADATSIYANRMMTLDIHALQIAGFYRIPVDTLYSFPTLVDYFYQKHRPFLENLVIMSPDEGGVARAGSLKDKLGKMGIGVETANGQKTRPKEGEIGEKYEIKGYVSRKNVLIVDDIIDSGNTIITAASTCKSLGSNAVWVYGTHGLFTEGIEKVVNSVDRVFVSDTLSVPPHEKIEVMSLTGLVGEAIFRTIRNESLTELFEIQKTI